MSLCPDFESHTCEQLTSDGTDISVQVSVSMPVAVTSCRQSQCRISGTRCSSTIRFPPHIGQLFHDVHTCAIRNSPESILDNHKTKVPAPICGIHLYGYILVLCDLMDIPHTFQIPAYGLFADAVLGRKLFQRLFALYIVADNLSFIAPYSAIKTTAAVLAFISLSTTSQTVPDHIFRPAKKHFLTISVIR